MEKKRILAMVADETKVISSVEIPASEYQTGHRASYVGSSVGVWNALNRIEKLAVTLDGADVVVYVR